jgi:selenide,water dikinase
LGEGTHADLLVGTGDDAAVWARPDGRALVATVDFFTPIVDDARTWGRIAAANAASDVYAMGATPLFALNLVAWPRDRLPLELLGDVLAGGAEVADAGGWMIVGGHSVDAPEPMYGQAVVGEVDGSALFTQATGRAGDALVLTKAIGTGLVATAVKRSDPAEVAPGGRYALAYQAAVASMVRLNAEAATVARASGASAATDVTGFGLLGHLHRLALASGLAAVIDVKSVPLLPGAWELIDDGFVPGGTVRNREFVRPWVVGAEPDEAVLNLLADAQTSGGLLFACPPAAAHVAVAELRRSGHSAATIGELIEDAPGTLQLR